MPTHGGGSDRSSARRFVGSRGWALADPDQQSARIVARSRTAYVGHHADRERSRRAVAEAAQGRPRLLLVTGDTGVGKSRLLEEIEREASSRGMRTMSLCCYAGEADDFAPLRPLGRRLGAEDEPLIGGDTLAAQAVGLADVLIAEARREPVAITVDDLDDADAGTLLVIRYLARWCVQHSVSGGVPLLLAGALSDTVRLGPEVLSIVDDAIEVIELEPLGPLESLELVKELALGDVPRVVSEAIAERCEGNPLVARVITDILLAENRVGPGALDTQLVGSDTMVWRLPRSPVGAIERQFESLDPPTRRVLASAAALNGDGPVRWVTDLSSETDDVVTASLLAAGEAGIATVGESVVFTHPLCRERALAELSIAELEQLHARIAQALLDAGVDSSPALVEHLRHAGSAVDPALVFAKAAEAGRAAAARNHWSVAVRCLQLASTVARRLPDVSTAELGGLWREMGDALLAAGEVHEARRWIDRSAELFEVAGDREGWAASVVAGLRCAVWAGAFGDHLDLDPLARIAADLTLSADVRCQAQLVASEITWMTGDAAGSLAWSSAAAALARTLEAPILCAESLVSSATGRWLELDLVGALADLDEAAQWTDRAPTVAPVALVQGRRALTSWWLGRVAEAEEAVALGLAAAGAANTPLERTLPLAAHAAIQAMRGDHADTMRATAEADLLCSLSGDYWSAAFTFPTAAASSVWHDDLEDALVHLDRWEATLEGVGSESRRLVRLMVDTTRHYVAALGGDLEQRSWFANLAPPALVGPDPHANVGSATFFSLLVEAADRLDLPDLAVATLPYLDDAMDRGQVLTSGWPALLARVGATAARLAGRDDAPARAAHALEVAEGSGLVVEQVRAHLEMARSTAATAAGAAGDEARSHHEAATTLMQTHGLSLPDTR